MGFSPLFTFVSTKAVLAKNDRRAQPASFFTEKSLLQPAFSLEFLQNKKTRTTSTRANRNTKKRTAQVRLKMMFRANVCSTSLKLSQVSLMKNSAHQSAYRLTIASKKCCAGGNMELLNFQKTLPLTE